MADELQWDLLLSEKRVGKSDTGNSAGNLGTRTGFESDYDRVIFSEPFRRLAKKTQVHPLAPNDHIHNRLIHSLEVGSVGRTLGKELQGFLRQSGNLSCAINELPLLVQIGCLVHDIGNPPFGHAGEFAIREWVAAHSEIVFSSEFKVSQETKDDLLMFEGNAQGFRLAARSDLKVGYMRLTFASLGAMIKYPWTSNDIRAKKPKKYNVFHSEKEIFDEITQGLGLLLPGQSVARHPLSFLTEAADDICYRILDMEDAVAMRIFPEKAIKDLFLRIADYSSSRHISIAEARGRAIGNLIKEIWTIFRDDYSNIICGRRKKDLKADLTEPFSGSLKEIKKRYEEVFSHRGKLGYEIGAYKVLGRIIKCLILSAQSLCKCKNFDDLSFISQKGLELAWGTDFVKSHVEKDYEWWLRQIFDFISGLTDNYAIQVSNEVEGMIHR